MLCFPYQLKIDFDHLFQCFETPFSFFTLKLQHLDLKKTKCNRFFYSKLYKDVMERRALRQSAALPSESCSTQLWDHLPLGLSNYSTDSPSPRSAQSYCPPSIPEMETEDRGTHKHLQIISSVFKHPITMLSCSLLPSQMGTSDTSSASQNFLMRFQFKLNPSSQNTLLNSQINLLQSKCHRDLKFVQLKHFQRLLTHTAHLETLSG